MSIAEDYARANVSVNAHSSVRVACDTADGSTVIVYVDPFLMDAEHGVSQAPHDADLVFFTHSHYDHFSPEDAAKVARRDTRYMMPATMVAQAVSAGIPEEAITGLDADSYGVVRGVQYAAAPAYNPGKPFHPEANRWLGYTIRVDRDTRVHICGDTDAIPELDQVFAQVFCIPVGGTYTMTSAEAAAFVREKAASASTFRLAIPTHYGSVTGTPDDGRVFAELVGDAVDVWLPLG